MVVREQPERLGAAVGGQRVVAHVLEQQAARAQDGLVVVTETYVDYLGQETTKDVEMRMRRNEGG